MKTLTLGIISLAFAASVGSASDYYFDVYNYDPDLDPDFFDPYLQNDGGTPLAVQQDVGDTDGGSEVDHTEPDGIIKSTDVHSDADT